MSHIRSYINRVLAFDLISSSFRLQFDGGVTFTTALQCKFYSHAEIEHSRWGTRLAWIEYACQTTEGQTGVHIVKEVFHWLNRALTQDVELFSKVYILFLFVCVFNCYFFSSFPSVHSQCTCNCKTVKKEKNL